ncbi:peptidase M76 family-domain-containing protein [Pavlovales sp. CCMP2436]|nr:peptidase M76 family-domain-containing protein [Pavlovales sp. CCMP2436]
MGEPTDAPPSAPRRNALNLAADPFPTKFAVAKVDDDIACQRMIDRAFATSAAVKTLMGAMERAGCAVNRAFFSCEHCEQDCQGGYDRDRGVILCQQHMQNSASLIESTMVHELIHAFDDCRAHVEWTDLKHHACTEIRAANLSSDCAFSHELMRGNFNMRAQQQKCVRRRAELSVAMNPSSKGSRDVKEAVSSVWLQCYKDKAPFDSVSTSAEPALPSSAPQV